MKYDQFLPWIIGAIVVYLILKNVSAQSASATGGSIAGANVGSAAATINTGAAGGSSTVGGIDNEIGLL